MDSLQEGYRKIISQIYAPRLYYERVRTFQREYKPVLATWLIRLIFWDFRRKFRLGDLPFPPGGLGLFYQYVLDSFG